MSEGHTALLECIQGGKSKMPKPKTGRMREKGKMYLEPERGESI